MKWLKENWFKISVLIILLIFGSYYFLVVVEGQKANARKEGCRRIAEEYRQNEISENPALSFFVPKYIYNKTLDTCLYSGGYLDPSIKKANVTKYIKDLNTNEELVGSTYIGVEKYYGVDNAEFAKQEEMLFK